jgi:hypothetical protein
MGERGIAFLPVREHSKDTLLFDPKRRPCFHIPYEVRQAHRRMKAGEDVDVIFLAVNSIYVALAVLQNTPDVPEKVLATVLPEGGLTVFGGKDNVIINLRIR